MTPVRERIIEVLKKYNVTLPEAPLDALSDAMERIIANTSARLKACAREGMADWREGNDAKRN